MSHRKVTSLFLEADDDHVISGFRQLHTVNVELTVEEGVANADSAVHW